MPSTDHFESSVLRSGALSCVGVGVEKLLEACIAGRSGIRDGTGRLDDSLWLPFPDISLRDEEFSQLDFLRKDLQRNRALLMLIHVALQALRTESSRDALGERDGLIVATTTSRLANWEQAYRGFIQHQAAEDFLLRFGDRQSGLLLQELSNFLKFRGPSFLVVSACAAQLQAISIAHQWIHSGQVDRCLVLGCETMSEMTQEGFRSFQLTSFQVSRPFDQERDGINLSEAASALLMSRSSDVPSIAKIVGVGLSSDAYHMTSPSPEGVGLGIAVKEALLRAQLEASQLDWIHAHGTGSRHNDAAEAAMLSSLLGGSKVPITSTKPIHGHALACSGGLEAALCIEAMNRGMVLPTLGLKTPDPTLPALNFSKQLQKRSIRYLLKTCLGFGGVNAALVLRNHEFTD